MKSSRQIKYKIRKIAIGQKITHQKMTVHEEKASMAYSAATRSVYDVIAADYESESHADAYKTLRIYLLTYLAIAHLIHKMYHYRSDCSSIF